MEANTVKLLGEIKDLAQLIEAETKRMYCELGQFHKLQTHVIESVRNALRQELDNLRRA